MAKTLVAWLEEAGETREEFAHRIGYSLSTVNKLCAPRVVVSPSLGLRDSVYIATRGEVDLVDLPRPLGIRAAQR